MDVAIGLPNTIAGATNEQVLEWARRADAAGAATDEDTVRSYLEAFEEAGADELFFFPTNPDPEQVDLLAEVALTKRAAA